MSILDARRGTGVLVVAAALLAVFSIASASVEASTLYACVKKNGNGRLFTKKPKCKKGESKISWNSAGVAGKNGANGLNGVNGANGAPGAAGVSGAAGANGAVAGYSATNTEVPFTQLASTQKNTTVVTKSLPAGSYIVSGKVNVLTAQLGKNAEGGAANTTYVDVSCTLTDSPAKGTVVSDTATWSGLINIPIIFFAVGNATLPMNLAVTTTTASTLELSCTNLNNDGKNNEGSSFSEEATEGVITAIQTTKNS